MISITRFHADQAAVVDRLRSVVEFWRHCEGCESVELAQNLDEPTLWVILSHWRNVGCYRRSFSGAEAKMLLTPILSLALDEPSAYLPELTMDDISRG